MALQMSYVRCMERILPNNQTADSSPTDSFWAVELLGEVGDLHQIERALNPQFDPWIQRQLPHADFALRSKEFDALATALQVHELSAALIQVLNGAVRLVSTVGAVRRGRVLRVSPNGQVKVASFAVGRGQLGSIVLEASGTLTNSDGSPVTPEPTSATFTQNLIRTAIEDANVADLLTFLGRADNWFDLYKAIEMAEALVDGEHALQALLKEGAVDFKNARSTANSYRHARPSYKPTRPVTFDEAHAMVRHAILVALAESGGK